MDTRRIEGAIDTCRLATLWVAFVGCGAVAGFAIKRGPAAVARGRNVGLPAAVSRRARIANEHALGHGSLDHGAGRSASGACRRALAPLARQVARSRRGYPVRPFAAFSASSRPSARRIDRPAGLEYNPAAFSRPVMDGGP